MLTTTFPNLSPLSKFTASCDFVLIGELHGINDNAYVVQNLLDEMLTYNPNIALAFEWLITKDELLSLRAFVDGVVDMIKTPAFFHDSDGRVTLSHITLLRHIRGINQRHPGSIQIHVFDTLSTSPETVMAENLMRIRDSTKAPLLVETGAVHAQKKKRIMGGILTEKYQTYSVFVQYERGQVFVEGKLYDVRDSASQRNGPEDLFDAVVQIPVAEPATGTPSLTIGE